MANQVLYGGFRRLSDFPIDPTSVIETYKELEYYLEHSPTAYNGQQLVVTNDPESKRNGLYSLHITTEKDEYGNTITKKTARHSATFEQIIDQVAIETENFKKVTLEPLEKEIRSRMTNLDETLNKKLEDLNKAIGVTSSGTGTDGNSLLDRINAVETLLELNDKNKDEDLSSRIDEALQAVNERVDDIVDFYSTKQELENSEARLTEIIEEKEKEINDQISQITKILDYIDDGPEAFSSLNEILDGLKRDKITLLQLKEDIENTGETLLSQMQNSVNVLDNKISEINRRLTNIDVILEGTGPIKELKAEVASINTKFTDEIILLKTRINLINSTLEGVNGNVSDSLDTLKNELNARITTNETNISATMEKVEDHRIRIGALEDSQTQQNNDISKLQEDVSTIISYDTNNRLNNLETDVERIQNTLDNIEGILEYIEKVKIFNIGNNATATWTNAPDKIVITEIKFNVTRPFTSEYNDSSLLLYVNGSATNIISAKEFYPLVEGAEYIFETYHEVTSQTNNNKIEFKLESENDNYDTNSKIQMIVHYFYYT